MYQTGVVSGDSRRRLWIGQAGASAPRAGHGDLRTSPDVVHEERWRLRTDIFSHLQRLPVKLFGLAEFKMKG
ncbi:MAG: hypothetical protein WD801_11790 [Gemmatimonadaceae bacterium]